MRGMGETTPLGIMTTLYEVMVALQAVVAPDDDTLVVTTVVQLLRSRRLTRLRADGTLRRTDPCSTRRWDINGWSAV
jgi:hypothetical protein